MIASHPCRGLTLPATLLATALLELSANAQAPAPRGTASSPARSAAQDATSDTRTAPAPNALRVRFACTEHKNIEATFVTGARSSVTLALSDGRTLSLPQMRSASGARYANKDERVVFWNKGDSAFLDEEGKTTYVGCVTAKDR